MSTLPHYLTAADIAQTLDVPRHRVVYLLAALEVQPAATVGKRKAYAEAIVEQVRAQLAEDRSAISSR